MTEQDQQGTSNAQESNTEQSQQQAEQTVSKADAEKLAAELNKYKALAVELQNKFKNQELEAARAANDWQKVAEHKEKELNDLLAKHEGFKKAVISDKKLSAIREEAIKAGLRKEAVGDLGLLDYPEVRLQTDDEGQFKVEGADKAIQRLKTTRPYLFQTSMPSVNLNTPTVTGGGGDKLTYESISKLEAEYKKNPNSANAEKLKGALIEFRRQANK